MYIVIFLFYTCVNICILCNLLRIAINWSCLFVHLYNYRFKTTSTRATHRLNWKLSNWIMGTTPVVDEG
ncbi:hypothetical protein RJT34_22891 [Clitoria ternatea]|uniref:Uncharacterized protein n=1 Tax=Clitoria ternatea TaxID=43366 RepID=A0AAN9FJX4_CLITE